MYFSADMKYKNLSQYDFYSKITNADFIHLRESDKMCKMMSKEKTGAQACALLYFYDGSMKSYITNHEQYYLNI